MFDLKEAREKREELSGQILNIRETAKNEKRNLTAEEVEAAKKIHADITELDGRIYAENLFIQVEAQKREDAKFNTREGRKALSTFRLTEAFRQIAKHGRVVEGAELEINEEGQNELRSLELSQVGNLTLPSRIMRRDHNITTDTQGKETVETNLGALIEALTPKPRVMELGATFVGNLRGNLDYPRKTQFTTAAFATEAGQAAEAQMLFDLVQLRPNRLTAYAEITTQLIKQASFDVEANLRADLRRAMERGIDSAAIQGTGIAPNPLGLLTHPDVFEIEIGPDANTGAVLSWTDIVQMETEIDALDALEGRMGYLTNPRVKGSLKGILKSDSASVQAGGFIWLDVPTNGPTYEGYMNGYRAVVSTLVPNALDKGTTLDTFSAIFFGDWSSMLIGQWGGIDLIVDPYTLARNAKVAVTINSFYDVQLRHGESFSRIVDVIA